MGGKYIFVAGAPGSRWSAVCRSIYQSADCDRTDSDSRREYRRRPDEEPMHIGAYWDPGMDFGTWFDRLDEHGREECEQAFDAPFSGRGARIIKAHTFCHHLAYLRRVWPECGVVLIYRENQSCLEWWQEAGGFDISYPNYLPYYRDLETMSRHIEQQNRDMLAFAQAEGVKFTVEDSIQLCHRLGIAHKSPKIDFTTLDAVVATVCS